MRQVRYSVAMSLDGYIAGPNGEADWIVMDPDIDFGAVFSRFDTLLIGRKSFEAMQAMGGGAGSTPEVLSVCELPSRGGEMATALESALSPIGGREIVGSPLGPCL